MTIEKRGYSFDVETQPDPDNEAPWNGADGHGPVSKWRPRDSKRPGERILHSDRSSCLFYDFAEAIKIAKRDGWGAKTPRRDGETKGAYRVRAVEEDMAYLAAWCRGDWAYVGVVVTLLDEDGEKTDETESLWGVEDSDTKYVLEVAQELADTILARIEVDNPQVQLSEN